MTVKPPRPTTLYRFFDEADRLLYVGIAGNPGRRFEQHASEKPWWHTVVRSTHTIFPSREAAAAAELAAIRSECPLHNIAGNGRRHTMSEATEPSVRRQDRLSAAAETPLRSDSLVGSFFLTDGLKRSWQGCVVAEPSPGVYLVETFTWTGGDSAGQELVRLSEMAGWTFYDDSRWMVNSYDHGVSQRWKFLWAKRDGESGDEPKPMSAAEILGQMDRERPLG